MDTEGNEGQWVDKGRTKNVNTHFQVEIVLEMIPGKGMIRPYDL